MNFFSWVSQNKSTINKMSFQREKQNVNILIFSYFKERTWLCTIILIQNLPSFVTVIAYAILGFFILLGTKLLSILFLTTIPLFSMNLNCLFWEYKKNRDITATSIKRDVDNKAKEGYDQFFCRYDFANFELLIFEYFLKEGYALSKIVDNYRWYISLFFKSSDR